MTPVRLPTPMGLLIDREQPLSFQFDGQTYQGLAGDSIASALLANQRWLLSRSFKYHRPRGPLSMAGEDANTLVQLPGAPNTLADVEPLTAGQQVSAQNVNGSLERDRNAWLGKASRFMPVGFYYRSFYKPKGAWKLWEPIIRKQAGLGVLDLTLRPDYHDKAFVFADVAVVGAGPAGLQAALSAAEAGAEVLLIEQQAYLGGALAWSRFALDAEAAEQLRLQLLQAVSEHPKVRVMTQATCNGWFTDNFLPVIQGQRMHKVRAQQVIVASGAYDQPVVFHNNDLPGIVLTSAAQRLMRLYAVKPGERAVVLTGNDHGYLAALELLEQGVQLAALVDLRSAPHDPALLEQLEAQQVPCHLHSTVYAASAGKAQGRIDAVEVRAISGRGSVSETAAHYACDLLCMSSGYMPAYQLLCQAGAQLSYDDEHAAFRLQQLPANLHIAGSVNGFHQLDNVLADARRAANAALSGLGQPTKADESFTEEPGCNADWPLFAHPKGKEFVDLDEDLQIADIINATRHGYRDIQLVKRFSTVGMGPSQGRHSALPTARLVAAATDRSVSETGVTTARPPFVAETLAHLAGRSFDPYRQTPLHDRHAAAGAQWMPAGNWQRPAYYGAPGSRNQSMQAEALQVRNGVGLIDVSTLGGLDIRGPDAAEFLNRFYTFAFVKQPAGRSRYALLTNEQGVVIDDGVCARFADEHFYVSATTSGVEQVYRQMLKWNAQWRLDVDIANVTSAFAAVNLAGPLSRQVLEKAGCDLDLSASAFPYLEVREGKVAGIPARLLRVGFVGELGYEIHVPARYAAALWDALMTAGADASIRPFGVEAQRLLRLEKGHVIISQDTDGMSHPGEIGMDWAIARKKPFFVGKRSIEILEAQAAKRRLVGFRLPAGSAQPLEGHLVLEGDNISGNVTSCEYSPSLQAIIGLAYCAPGQASPGQSLPIRVAGGQVVQAEVIKPPFYDPDNQRQEL
ncbi:MAG: 2Fe-2S iron-sulfur cluster-binding protein [Gammaproteobacteria bacterium]|nr:2Fe-2S iron-sulfur cluster-binding protein [Gammaproteobacteria bacterium]